MGLAENSAWMVKSVLCELPGQMKNLSFVSPVPFNDMI